jgi:hypothetical protein
MPHKSQINSVKRLNYIHLQFPEGLRLKAIVTATCFYNKTPKEVHEYHVEMQLSSRSVRVIRFAGGFEILHHINQKILHNPGFHE